MISTGTEPAIRRELRGESFPEFRRAHSFGALDKAGESRAVPETALFRHGFNRQITSGQKGDRTRQLFAQNETSRGNVRGFPEQA